MKILVTGAMGFIGQHLTRELAIGGHTAICVDTKIDHSHDMRDPTSAARVLQWDPDVVVHLAARVGRLFGEDNHLETILDNAGMTATIARACGYRGIPLVYASTSEVYGDCLEMMGAGFDDFADGGLSLDGYPLPHNLYGLSKRWGEEACRLYAPNDLTILRLSMPYGPGLPPGYGRAALINFLWNALHNEPLTVHKGSERSWCWIGDTTRAIRMIIESGRGGAWNVGRDDNALPMLDVARMACDLVGASHDLITEVDAPARQTVVKRLAAEKLRRLGWRPEVDLADGMNRTLQWVRDFDEEAVRAA